VHDYSEVVFPADARNCTKCHEAGVKQGDAWLKPSRAACGACHDNVNFATGAARMLPGVVMKIMDVSGAAPGKPLTITFSVKDKAGKPIEPSQMARLSFRIAGPNNDYRAQISETALTARGSNAATPVSLQVMFHRIHTGKELSRPYKIGTASFNEVGYPGNLRMCSQCHLWPIQTAR